eukprot:TRINITY_DN49955_c0_g1_i1.p2 TRINITY_DN49955_c0_g1~~TRINITY_DN49955_c0_g1_i1.p2  ORF type:complete len:123 (+),score=6.72 TRINITY_DN49955_c0_g1_i1:38-370(+)
MVCIFGVFWAILPHVWESDVAEAHADVQSTGGLGGDEVSSSRGKYYSPAARTRSWTGGWSRNRVPIHQANILIFFGAETKNFIIATQMFVYALCTVVNNISFGMVCSHYT